MSSIVTSMEQFPVLPAESVAKKITVVFPSWKGDGNATTVPFANFGTGVIVSLELSNTEAASIESDENATKSSVTDTTF